MGTEQSSAVTPEDAVIVSSVGVEVSTVISFPPGGKTGVARQGLAVPEQRNNVDDVSPQTTPSDPVTYTERMSTPTREEFEARLETVEARMDARVAKIEGKIDTLVAQMSERDRRQEERDKRIEMLAESAAKSAEHASTLKGHFWGAVVTIVLSVGGIAIASYFSTQSSNIMIAQTTLAAFQAGQANPPPPAKKP